MVLKIKIISSNIIYLLILSSVLTNYSLSNVSVKKSISFQNLDDSESSFQELYADIEEDDEEAYTDFIVCLLAVYKNRYVNHSTNYACCEGTEKLPSLTFIFQTDLSPPHNFF